MELKIFNYPDNTLPPKHCYLKYFYEDDKIICFACDKNGNKMYCGGLFSISNKGIKLYKNINPELGFELDDDGRLIVY